MPISPDRKRQVETTRQKHGEDHYKKIGRKGAEKSPTKFNSETGRANVQKRWERYRAEQANKEKGEKS